ncbi:MAG: thymidine phosphorylase, partial [Acidimicrobiales bacterium]
MVDLIRAKRDGRALSPDQLAWLVEAYADGRVPDEQVSALLMAVVWRGMEAAELAAFTRAIVDSGDRLDLSLVGRPTVDKHSTGGVGDTVSLILAPLVAACGAAVPQLSGRGLGHTGGTLDKLETIPGLRTALSPAEMTDVLGKVGCVICAAGPGLAPADARLYALRDVTGTVESVPLIAASIMGKKIAEGTGSLVLDVKVGSGAFLPDLDQARLLARTMVDLGAANGVATSALLTRMDAPLGRAAGNALEVAEALAVLRRERPGDDPLVTVTLALAAEMLALVGLGGGGPGDPLAADPAAALSSGAALHRFEEMVRAQGGDPDAPLPVAAHRRLVEAPA